MRIWDRIPPEDLCRKHLLGEHRELHGLWNILVRIDSGQAPETIGYSRHPETRRWIGHGPALYARHRDLVAEMTRRGYNHESPLPEVDDGCHPEGTEALPEILDDQIAALAAKGCECRPGGRRDPS